MSINLPTHFVQQYSTNLQLLLQVEGKLRGAVMNGNHVGKQASPVDQFGSLEMQPVTNRFAPLVRSDLTTDRRWVYPSDYDLVQMIDSFDKLRLITDPSSAYVQTAVKACGRQIDKLILAAFFGTAKTGEAGGTSTIFTAANEVDVATGGANSKLNVAKLQAVKELMEANFIDFSTEEVYVGVTAADKMSLFNDIRITSDDYTANRFLDSGELNAKYLGFTFIQHELIESQLAGTNEVTLPVWVKSGMHLGIWQDMQNNVSQRDDLTSQPWQLYTQLTAGATRLEEDKVYAIESYRA